MKPILVNYENQNNKITFFFLIIALITLFHIGLGCMDSYEGWKTSPLKPSNAVKIQPQLEN